MSGPASGPRSGSASGDDESDIPFADSPILTYMIPFAGALLIAAGIGAGVVGAYAPVQEELDLCSNPTITVYGPDRTAEVVGEPGEGGLTLERFDFAELSGAEQDAFEHALDEPFSEGAVDGEFPNRKAFERGAVVRYQGADRYVTLTSANECTGVDPLLFPLGVAAILLGIVWILAPPMYRKLATVERGA